MIFDPPIDRTWIPGGFQPSVHSETASRNHLLSMGLENELSFHF